MANCNPKVTREQLDGPPVVVSALLPVVALKNFSVKSYLRNGHTLTVSKGEILDVKDIGSAYVYHNVTNFRIPREFVSVSGATQMDVQSNPQMKEADVINAWLNDADLSHSNHRGTLVYTPENKMLYSHGEPLVWKKDGSVFYAQRSTERARRHLGMVKPLVAAKFGPNSMLLKANPEPIDVKWTVKYRNEKGVIVNDVVDEAGYVELNNLEATGKTEILSSKPSVRMNSDHSYTDIFKLLKMCVVNATREANTGMAQNVDNFKKRFLELHAHLDAPEQQKKEIKALARRLEKIVVKKGFKVAQNPRPLEVHEGAFDVVTSATEAAGLALNAGQTQRAYSFLTEAAENLQLVLDEMGYNSLTIPLVESYNEVRAAYNKLNSPPRISLMRPEPDLPDETSRYFKDARLDKIHQGISELRQQIRDHRAAPVSPNPRPLFPHEVIREIQDRTLTRFAGPKRNPDAEKHIVMCRVSGGTTGTREGQLKNDSGVIVFPDKHAAEAEALRLSKRMNHQYSTGYFEYWAIPLCENPPVRVGGMNDTGQSTILGHAAFIGRHDAVPREDFDPVEMELGIHEEMEHTDDAAIAEAIARDHLAEDPQYYSKLRGVFGPRE
jgi:hypothetical protein